MRLVVFAQSESYYRCRLAFEYEIYKALLAAYLEDRTQQYGTMSELINTEDRGIEALVHRVASIIEEARKRVLTSINLTEVYTKYQIGRYIIEEEQQGAERAQYGKQILQSLSEQLTERFGAGWSYANLKNIRQFLKSIQKG